MGARRLARASWLVFWVVAAAAVWRPFDASCAFAGEDDPATVPAPAAVEERDPLFDDPLEAELAEQRAGFPDPLEELNRRLLSINQVIDHVVLDPLTRAYAFIVPEPVKPAIRRSFLHFSLGSVLLNDILQLRLRPAAQTVGRFAVNSTTGLAGFLDFARCVGWGSHHADFGQTLSLYGVGSGPYLVLPVFGPTNVRDAFGDVVDGLLHPARYFLGPASQLTYGGSAGLSTREAYYDAIKELEKSSVDYYAALRNAYYQARMAEINERVDAQIGAASIKSRHGGPCTSTLAGDTERTVGPPPARGLAAEPVSRWSRSEDR